MSPFGAYFDRMSTLRLRDRDFERLLSGEATGSEELADLEAFVAALATGGEPPRDSSYIATALAATARSSAPRPVRSVFSRLVVLSASFAILLAFSGVAMAADGAAPGDLLYGIDRALESVGMGDGGIDERIDEFEVLRDRDRHEEAIEFLEKEMQTASPTEAVTAGEHLAAASGAEEAGGEPSVPQTAAPEDAEPNDDDPNDGDPNTSPGAIAPDSGSHDDESNEDSPSPDPADDPSDDPSDDTSDDNGLSVGQGDNSPPGQVKKDEKRAEPETAGPKESPGEALPEENSSPSDDQGSNDPGSNGNQTDPDNNGNTDPGTPQGNALGQDEGQGGGQGQGNGQGQGQGQQGQGQGQGLGEG